MKNKVTVIVEKTDTGYSAYTENVAGIITVGDTINGIEQHMQEAIKIHKETLEELGEPVPKVLQDDYTLDFHLNIEYLFHILPYLNISKFAEKAGINPALMRQYASGVKSPGVKQAMKIGEAIKTVSREMGSVSIV